MGWRIVRSVASVLARVALAGVLGYAGWMKLESGSSIKEFARAIDAYRVLPDHLVIVAAYAFPWLEVVAAVLLILGLWTRAAGIVASMLLAGFIGAIVSVLLREDVVVTECGCFAKAGFLCSGAPGACHLVQNSLLLIAAIGLSVLGGQWASADHALERRPRA